MLIGRLNEASRRRSWVSEALQKDGAFESYLAKLWFDIHVHDQRVVDFVTGILNPQRLVMGTNFAGWDQHGANGEELWLQQLANNARRLLRLD